MSFEEDGREILIPTVSEDGRILSDDEAVKLYHRTGKHLGQFRSATEATAYAQQLHEQQAQEYGVAVSDDPPKGRHGFAGQTEKEFDPESVTDWINVLHNATAVPQDSPDYGDARAVAAQAWARIGHLNRKASTADREAQNFKESNPVLSGLAGLAHGASLGIGEPIAGAIDAATGGTFREGAQRYREGLEQAAVSNPATFAAAEFAGQVAPSLLPIRSAVGTVQARVPLSTTDKLLRVARGGAAGATVGGVTGFSEGGEDPGDFSQRFDRAKTGAKIGGAMGGVLTGVGLRASRATAEKDADLLRKGVEDTQAQVNLDASRLRLQHMQSRMDAGDASPTTDIPIRQAAALDPPLRPTNPDIVAAVRDYEAGRITGADLRTAMDVAQGRTAPAIVGRIQPEASGPPQGPPSPLRPSELVEDQPIRKARKGKAPKVGAKIFGAEVVPAGEYQRAAPATRMESAPQGGDKFAQAIADDPASALAQIEMSRALGFEPPPHMVEKIARLMAARGVP